MRSELNIIRRDWSEYKVPILGLTAAMFLPFLVAGTSGDVSNGFLTGMLISAAYGYAQFTFFVERQKRTLDLLLSLPLRPLNLILAKYVSACSMILFSVNVSGLLLGNFHDLLITNAIAIFMATFCMTPAVLSDKAWAPHVPLWLMVAVILPTHKLVARFWPAGLESYRQFAPEPALVAAAALAVSPVIAVLAALFFERRSIT